MDLYTTAQLLGMIEETVNTPHSFALDTFFPKIEEQETEEIMFDKLPLDDRIAPFVSPNLPGKSNSQRGFKTDVFKPAYIKPLDTVSPSQALKRQAGEPLTGSLSPQQRRDIYVNKLLGDQINAIKRRKEWMAWQVLLTGKVIVEGDDYPSATVDFGRDAGHTELLSGAAAWDQGTADVVAFFDARALKVQDATGFAATTHIMDPQAWALARKNAEFKDVLDNRRQSSGDVELGSYALANGDADSRITSARYMGNMGDHDFYVFAGMYTDIDGTRKRFLPANTCVSADPVGFQGMQVHGAIEDHESLQATEFFPKMWDEQNPSKRNLMTQSAPLTVPGRVNCANVATVI